MNISELTIEQLTEIIRGVVRDELDDPVIDIERLAPDDIPEDVTIVTGLWDLGRGSISEDFKRGYDHYLEKFEELLAAPVNMFIYVSQSDVDFVWKHRSPKNTHVHVMELDELNTLFDYESLVEPIRTNKEWRSQADWLSRSPQVTLKYYNPVVMSKMFLLSDARIYNPFNTEYFFWIDGGITNTVDPGYFTHDKVFSNLTKFAEYTDSFIYLTYPYETDTEIHGFKKSEMDRLAKKDVKYVCRGGFFGGRADLVRSINDLYYKILESTLQTGYMGTEESIFTLISHRRTHDVYNFAIGSDGMVWPFFEALKDIDRMLDEIPDPEMTASRAKVALYVLGFNSPNQFKTLCESLKNSDPDFLNKTEKYLINNSTNTDLFEEYDNLCVEYGFEEIHHPENLGVCGGRQYAALHFEEHTDADFYLFFEDDMRVNAPDLADQTCVSGFVRYVPNLFQKAIGIIVEEKFDILKLSFSEFYGTHNTQWAWYNVPQEIRTKFWPHYDKLPEVGLDPNAPLIEFKNIKSYSGLAYVTGEIYYSNWPQLVSREGNRKMFLTETWSHPFEQTWMSYIYQRTKEAEITPGLLLASPITHNREDHYDSTLRKES